MRPNAVHAVLTLEDSIALGGHFYNRSCFKDTFSALVAEFFNPLNVTNAEHRMSTLLLGKYMAFLVDALAAKGDSKRMCFDVWKFLKYTDVDFALDEELLPSLEELGYLVLTVKYIAQFVKQLKKDELQAAESEANEEREIRERSSDYVSMESHFKDDAFNHDWDLFKPFSDRILTFIEASAGKDGLGPLCDADESAWSIIEEYVVVPRSEDYSEITPQCVCGRHEIIFKGGHMRLFIPNDRRFPPGTGFPDPCYLSNIVVEEFDAVHNGG